MGDHNIDNTPLVNPYKALARLLNTFYTNIVTDLINRIVQVLREDLYWFRISAQQAGLLEPAESSNKG